MPDEVSEFRKWWEAEERNFWLKPITGNGWIEIGKVAWNAAIEAAASEAADTGSEPSSATKHIANQIRKLAEK